MFRSSFHPIRILFRRAIVWFVKGRVLLSFRIKVRRKTSNTFLKGQCHDMDFFEDLNILISTVCVCGDGFPGYSIAFHYPIQSLTFHLLFWNYFITWKMLSETLLRSPLSVILICGLWSGLLEVFSKLVSNFKEAS